MAFLTVQITTPLGDYQFSAGRRHHLLRALQRFLELELRRDFESIAVALTEADTGNVIAAQVAGPLADRPLTPEERGFLTKLNAMFLGSGYVVADSGDVVTVAREQVPGLAVDWRALRRAVAAQGEGLLPGFVAAVLDGAAEIRRNGGTT